MFDTQPSLGTPGSIRIFRKADDALVDVIKARDEVDAIGFPGQDQVRVVRVDGLISVAGNTATIGFGATVVTKRLLCWSPALLHVR